MIGDKKIVEFEKYCPTCKYFNTTRNEETQENEEPCNECLEIPARTDSRRPECYEEST